MSISLIPGMVTMFKDIIIDIIISDANTWGISNLLINLIEKDRIKDFAYDYSRILYSYHLIAFKGNSSLFDDYDHNYIDSDIENELKECVYEYIHETINKHSKKYIDMIVYEVRLEMIFDGNHYKFTYEDIIKFICNNLNKKIFK